MKYIINSDGFFTGVLNLIIDKALTDNQIVLLRKAFNKTFKKLKGKEHIDYNLFEYDKNFLFLLDNKPVIKRISAILGNCIQLHSASARLSSPGSKNQNWHRDGHWPVDPNGTPIGSIPGQINCGYYLDPLTEQNGPIAIVPGSQKALFKPPKKDFEFPDQKIIYANPGKAIIFNGWIYHRGLGNKSKSNRRVCLICYQNSWMKSRETFDGPIISKIKNNDTDFDELSLERGLTEDDVAYGTFSKEKLADASEEIFSAKIGEVVGPIETDLGPVIFRVREIVAAESTSFDDAKNSLAKEYALSEAKKLVDEKIEKFTN